MDDSYQSLIDAAGNSDEAEGVTVHNHRDIGLVAWTVVEDGHMHHIYPLRPESAHSIMKDLKARGFANFSISRKIHVDARTGRLAPAVEKPLGHPEDGTLPPGPTTTTPKPMWPRPTVTAAACSPAAPLRPMNTSAPTKARTHSATACTCCGYGMTTRSAGKG